MYCSISHLGTTPKLCSSASHQEFPHVSNMPVIETVNLDLCAWLSLGLLLSILRLMSVKMDFPLMECSNELCK